MQDHIEDLSISGCVSGKRRGGAREAEDSSRTNVKTAPVLFAGKISDESSRRARGTANFRPSSALFGLMTTLEEAHRKAYPPQVSTALFGPPKALGQTNCKANPSQVLNALFGSMAVFGLITGVKTQGKTGQGVSAADFLPATTTGANFQGKTGQGVSAANFFPQ